jgi:hypothetical protein
MYVRETVHCAATCLRLLQAIAALNKAVDADPTNLEVLLSLGVSHTNELDAGKHTRQIGLLVASVYPG